MYLFSKTSGIKQSKREDSQKIPNDSFFRLDVTTTQCFIRREKYAEAGIEIEYADDKKTQVFA